MRPTGNRLLTAFISVVLTSTMGFANAAENFYFRLRPSVSILNQDPFSVRIDGDRAGVVGSAFRAKAEASAPRETLRFSVADGDLPPGVSLDSASGSITGQPLARGRFMATLKAEDAFSSASAPLAITVYDTLEIQQTVAEYATVGKPYSALFNGLGGDQNYSWTLSGTPPTGLTFGNVSAPTATLSGTPTVAGTWGNLRASVSDTADHSASGLPFSVTVADPLTLAGSPAPVATVGESYSATFTSTGGHNPISWTLTPPLPDVGLSFNNGVISGMPDKAQTITGLVVHVTDKATNTVASAPFSIAISQPLALAGAPSSVATVGVGYSAAFTASGGAGGNVWSSNKPLPDGLSIPNGAIAGTPTKVETVSGIVVTVKDRDGRTAQSSPFSIAVADELKVSGTPSPMATVGVAYTAAFTTTGGDGNNSWTVASGALPKGLTLDNGSISGSPTEAETASNIIVRVTDGAGRTAQSNPFTITVSDALKIAGTPSPNATVGVAYSATFTSSGGVGTKTWAVVSGTLPNGLSLANGTVSGSPTVAGTASSIIVRVTDGDGRTADSIPFSITVADALTIAGPATPIGTVGTVYSTPFTITGGDGHYTYSLVSGSLPDGLSVPNGTITGTPTRAGTWSNVIVRVTDGIGRTIQSSPFSITVQDALVLAGSASGVGTTGSGLGGGFSASGGDGSYTWRLVGGPLPTGVSLTATGAFSGAASQVGTFGNIVVQVQDGKGRVKQSNPFSIVISSPMWMTGGLSGSGKVGDYYQATLYANGGNGNYTWSIIGGSLPYGLNFSNGTVWGTPNTASTWGVSIRASDSDGRYVDYYIAIGIARGPIREPAAGDVFNYDPHYAFYVYGGAITEIFWNGARIGAWGGDLGAVDGGGGVIYYRGDYRGSYSGKVVTQYGNFGYYYIYGVYRVIP
jgi:hypothetical protein